MYDRSNDSSPARTDAGAEPTGKRDGDMAVMAEYVRGRPLPHLQAWRLSRLLAQAELAEKAGIAKSTLARAERGDAVVSFANIRKLAKALDIAPDVLLNKSPDEQAKKSR